MSERQLRTLCLRIVCAVVGIGYFVGYVVVVGDRLSENRGAAALALACMIGVCYRVAVDGQIGSDV